MKRLVLLGLALVCGCPHRGAVDFGPTGEVTDAQQMLALLQKQDARFVTIEGNVKLKVQSPQASGSVSQYIAVTRPAGLHIETFNFFGKPVSVLVSDGERFSLYDADKNVFYEGDATVDAMSRFLPVALSPEEAAALLLGQVPRIPAQSAKLEFNADKQRYELTLEAGKIRQTLYIDPNLDVRRSIVTGADAYDLELSDYANEPGGRFPHTLQLDAPTSNVELTYKYSDVKVNGAPNLTNFHQDAPKSAKVVQLDAQGRELPSK